MRHRNATTRLPGKPAHARMMARNLVTSILLYEKVRTTKKRAEVVVPMVDRLITTGKKQKPYSAIRAINRVVTDKNACRKIMQVLITRYADRSSGMTRITPVGLRKGDGAPLVDIELLDRDTTAEKAASSPKKIKA